MGYINRFITIDEFEAYQQRGKHYEGFVIGLGYAYVGRSMIPPPQYPGFRYEGRVPLDENMFTILRYQSLEISLEAVERSLQAAEIERKHDTVRQGDTLQTLATRNNVTVVLLMKWNNISNAAQRLEEGRQLVVAQTFVVVSRGFEALQDFWESMLNVESRQEILAKYNNFVRKVSSGVGIVVDIADGYVGNKAPWLRKAKKGIPHVGLGTTIMSAFLAIDALRNGKPWKQHAYNAAIGGVSLMGPVGKAVSMTIDHSVQGGRFFVRAVDWINTEGFRRVFTQGFRAAPGSNFNEILRSINAR